ncbi:MAG TPA: hypothetical protein VMW50_03460 [Dehalococcoidia bacterium]|nr:hypothetical protein [Dehalococcoidia bacterium]
MERQLLDIRIQLEMCITEREGMIAENLQRAACSQSMAYVSTDFESVNITLSGLMDVIRNL